MLSEQQVALTGQLQAVQNNLSDLDQHIKDTASAVVQFSDALTADIERLDTQSARFAEQLAALTSFGLNKINPKSQQTMLPHLIRSQKLTAFCNICLNLLCLIYLCRLYLVGGRDIRLVWWIGVC